MRTQTVPNETVVKRRAEQEFGNSGSLDQDSLEREEETLSDDYEQEESKQSLQNYTDSEQATPTPSKFHNVYHKVNRFGPSLSGHVPHAHCDLTPSITDLTPSPSAPPRDKRYIKQKLTIQRLCNELVALVDFGPLQTPDSEELKEQEIILFQAASELRDIFRPKYYPDLLDDVVQILGFTAVSRLLEQFGRGANRSANCKVLLQLVNLMVSPLDVKENTDRALLQKSLLSGLVSCMQRLHVQKMDLSVKTEIFFLLGQLFNTTSPYLVEVITAGALQLLVNLLRSQDISKGDPQAILTGLDVLTITSKLPKSLRSVRASLLVQAGAVDVLSHYLRCLVAEQEQGKELALSLYAKESQTLNILDMFSCISEGPVYARKQLCVISVWDAFRELSRNFSAKQEALTLVKITDELSQDERMWNSLAQCRLFSVIRRIMKYCLQFERAASESSLPSQHQLLYKLLQLVQKLTAGSKQRTVCAVKDNLHDVVMHIGVVKPAFLQQVLAILSHFALAPQTHSLKSNDVLEHLMKLLSRVANQEYNSKVRVLETTLLWVQRSPEEEALVQNLDLLTQMITECHSPKHLSWLLDTFVKILGLSPKLSKAVVMKRECLSKLVELLKKVVWHYDPQQGFVDHHSIKSLLTILLTLTDTHTQKNKFLRSLKIEPTLKQIQKISAESGLEILQQVTDIVLSLYHTE